MSPPARSPRPLASRSASPVPIAAAVDEPATNARITVLALVAACAGVLAALWMADRAMATVATQLPPAAAATIARFRVASWLLAATALGLAAYGMVRERHVRARAAQRAQELERLSAELMQANRAKSEFLANVSHELRTPLNAVVGFVELLQDGVYGDLTPRQIGPVGRIAVSATHLRHLVDQILDLAKITAGRLEVHTERVTLRPFVLDVAGDIESLVQDKGLALSISVPASLPRLRIDPLHVRQVLVNLLGNAIKFTPSGGRVGVRGLLVESAAGAPPFAAATDGILPADRSSGLHRFRLRRRPIPPARVPVPPTAWIALQVTDTGIGIARDDQARIFDEFEQLGPRTGDSAERGTGLGLAISRRLARLLGGDLTLESTVGVGSTFTLWLPVDPAELAARPGVGSASPVPDRRRSDRRAAGRRRTDHREHDSEPLGGAPSGESGGPVSRV